MENFKVPEFVPAGQVALTEEQFPELLGGLGDEPKKKGGNGKKGGKIKKSRKGGVIGDVKPIVEKFNESMPWKGRKSEFFVMQQAATQPDFPDPMNPMNYELNDGQWEFIFKYYPEYAGSPF